MENSEDEDEQIGEVYALQCFTSDKEKTEHPETWRGCTARPRIIYKGLWVMGKDVGTLLECTHAIILEGGGR